MASASDEHIRVLAEVATVITDPDQAERLRGATDPAVVLDLLAPSPEQEEATH